jgi:hypothetical protein
LKALSLEPLHGVGFAQVTQGAFQVSFGSLFPSLHRMEERGWVEAEWRASENNRRAKILPAHFLRAGAAQGRRTGLEPNGEDHEGAGGIRLSSNGSIMVSRTVSLLRNLLRRSAVEQILDEELQSSVALLTQEKMQEGVEQAKEESAPFGWGDSLKTSPKTSVSPSAPWQNPPASPP